MVSDVISNLNTPIRLKSKCDVLISSSESNQIAELELKVSEVTLLTIESARKTAQRWLNDHKNKESLSTISDIIFFATKAH